MSDDRIILHVDMDSFFASVEMRENPNLIGKPVIVGADPKGGKGRGVVSTCSYEARKYGVHSGMPISKAYKLCPSAVYQPVNFPLYTKASENVMCILRSYAEKFQQVSIDEAYLDVSSIGSFEAAKELALKI
jgi:DNA polymerase IV (DinB-like DNA polymerase)